MLKYGLPSVAALLLILAVLSVARTQPVHKEVPPPSVPALGAFEKQVGAVGLVEASSENIAISLPVPGLVREVLTHAGDFVRKGQPLFKLDDSDLEAELRLRASAAAVAAVRLEKLKSSPRPEELPVAEARVQEAEELMQDADVQLRLMESVRDKRAIREEDLLRRRIAVSTAKAKLQQVRADYALLKAGAWGPDIEVAKAELAQAQREVERVRADIGRMTVTAPIDGEILQCKIRPGEYAQAGPLPQPLMLMGDTRHLNVRVDIDEQDAGKVRPGARAVASPRGNGQNRLPIHFVRFEPYVIPKKNLTNDVSERVDTRVLEVVFALDTGAPVRAGQQMDVFVQAN